MTPQGQKRDAVTRTSFNLPTALKKRLEHAATNHECDMQDIVVEALEVHLAKIERTSN
jgi:predicted DNA-binding protein